MGDKKTFAVATLGITDHEQSVLKHIFKLSQYRTYTYTFILPNQPGQILIVDADDPEVVAEWNAMYGGAANESLPSSSNVKTPLISTVMVTKEKVLDQFPLHINRPFVATRVLSILDEVVAKAPLFQQSPSVQQAPVIQQPIFGEEPPHVAFSESPALTKALVVDDSSTIRRQIELELKLFSIDVDMAESGERAFELLAEKSYDMIFLDVVLPGIDGYQICKNIKKNKSMKKTPVIMLTSKSSPFDRVKGSLAGCDTYLTKPVKQSSFQKVIKKYLKSLQSD